MKFLLVGVLSLTQFGSVSEDECIVICTRLACYPAVNPWHLFHHFSSLHILCSSTGMSTRLCCYNICCILVLPGVACISIFINQSDWLSVEGIWISAQVFVPVDGELALSTRARVSQWLFSCLIAHCPSDLSLSVCSQEVDQVWNYSIQSIYLSSQATRRNCAIVKFFFTSSGAIE